MSDAPPAPSNPSGRSPAFDAIVAEHSPLVRRLCTSILRDDHLGADAAQETFLRLWQRLARSEPLESSGAWLRRTAVNAALDLVRRRRVRDGRAQEPVEASSVEPSEVAADKELHARLERALAQLSEGQRTVFLLRHDAGLPLREVARTLGLATSTVKTQFARACLRLQDHLAPFAPERSIVRESNRDE